MAEFMWWEFNESCTVEDVSQRRGTPQKTTELVEIPTNMEGLKNRGIAERLGIREQVVKNHLQSIFNKTRVLPGR